MAILGRPVVKPAFEMPTFALNQNEFSPDNIKTYRF